MKLKMKNISVRLVLFLLWFPLLKSNGQGVPFPLDSMLSKSLDSMQVVLNVKSLSAAMQFPDTAVWARATGISSLVPLDSVTTSDVYLIGSVTKTMTSACVLQLAEQGVLNLDDSLYQWIDTIQYINPNITIRQLLRHESGIYDVLSNPACQPTLLGDQDSIWDPIDLIQTFIAPPQFNPGAAWSYSNTNYFLLAQIIKEATGNYFYQELRNRYFIPLAMNTIAIPSFETLNSPVAHVWMDLNGDGVTEDAHNFYINYLSLNSAGGAAGGYFATPTDVTRWMRTYMRGDILSAATMTEAKTTVAAPGLPSTTYGLGLMRKFFAGYEGFGHGGDLAYAASSWYFPLRDLSITVFTNDSKNNSWTLVPVVTVLLKTYNNYLATLTGITESANNLFELQTVPNPFVDELQIRFAGLENYKQIEVVLNNTLGQQILAKQFSNQGLSENVLSLSGLSHIPGGIYLVSLYADGNPIATKRVVRL